MKDRVVAPRYARALFRSAAPDGVARLRQELNQFVRLLSTDESLSRMLRHPLLPVTEKVQRALKLLDKKSSVHFERFLKLVLEKKRLPLLPYMAELFGDLADESEGLRKVYVKSAASLKPEQIEDLEGRLSKVWKGRVRVEASVDENLLGGLVLRMGDRVWDRSLRAQLSQIREKFLRSADV